MSSVVRLSRDTLEEIQRNLQEAENVFTNQIESLLSKLKFHDETYSDVFVKCIGEDAQLRGKYDLICDLRKSSVDEYVLEVRSALNTQRDANRNCLMQFNDIISNSSSVESDIVSPIKMEGDKPEISTNQCHRSTEQFSQKPKVYHKDDATINEPKYVSNIYGPDDGLPITLSNEQKQKWNEGPKQMVDNHAHEMRILAEQNRIFDLCQVRSLWQNHFNRSLRQTCSEKIIVFFRLFPDLFDVKEIVAKDRWTAISKVYDYNNYKKQGEVPNISGVWVYPATPADNQLRMVLQDDAITGHVVGIIVSDNNETQCSIEGDRKIDVAPDTPGQPYYRLCKIYPDGQRRYHSAYLGPNHDNMSIFKDEDTESEVVELKTRQIPMHFQEQMKPVQMSLMKMKEVGNTTVNVDCPIVHDHGDVNDHSNTTSCPETKLVFASVTGLWHQNENIRYMLFEDVGNKKLIGFKQHNEVTESMITGERRPGNTFKVMEKMNHSQQCFEYMITLFPKKKVIKMKRTEGDDLIIPEISIKLRLKEKCVPPDLIQEILLVDRMTYICTV